MPFRSGAFDTVVVCDTLEHILDDRSALAECHRILRPGGMAILTVPQSDDSYATYEDASITTEARRIEHFGQHDHVRNYGGDFGERVADAGFDVTCISAASFDAAFVARHVLLPQIRFETKLGWNNRRVYFAERN